MRKGQRDIRHLLNPCSLVFGAEGRGQKGNDQGVELTQREVWMQFEAREIDQVALPSGVKAQKSFFSPNPGEGEPILRAAHTQNPFSTAC